MSWLMVLVVAISQLWLAGAQDRGRAQPGFVVYDGTSYAQKPDLATYGVKNITVIYSAALWKNSEDRLSMPDENTLRAVAAQAHATTGIAAIDIESWLITGPAPRVADSIQKYESTLAYIKRAEPALRAGYYGFPVRNYTAPLRGAGSSEYRNWQALNDRLASIVQLGDALFPSIYTFTQDQDGWRTCAIAQIQEARRLAPDKPVYVFMWPQYYKIGKAIDYLPAAYWRMELETARQYADGAVLWGGTGQTWDDHAPW